MVYHVNSPACPGYSYKYLHSLLLTYNGLKYLVQWEMMKINMVYYFGVIAIEIKSSQCKIRMTQKLLFQKKLCI